MGYRACPPPKVMLIVRLDSDMQYTGSTSPESRGIGAGLVWLELRSLRDLERGSRGLKVDQAIPA